MLFTASVHAKAIALIKLSIEMTTAAGSGHPTSAASLAHLVTLLMYNHMRYDPAYPHHPAADRLVLSEGHACPIVYAAAADLGIAIGKEPESWRPMTRDEALRLRAIGSEIDGHPNPAEGFPFFPAATGSLGQGLSIANGLALAARLDGSDKHIFCLIGDGESREGQIWEALDFLVDYRLTAVCPIFNCNGYGQSDKVSPQQTPEILAAKLRAAGVDAQVIDGHDPEEIQQALELHAAHAQDPAYTAGPLQKRKKFKSWPHSMLWRRTWGPAGLRAPCSVQPSALQSRHAHSQSSPHVAFFRAWTTVCTPEGKPLLYLLQPADAYAAYALTVAMAEHEGPCYLRTLRPDVPFLYNNATAFTLGGHHVLAGFFGIFRSVQLL
jgi:transketolase N-terminal domain/subunit